MTLKKFDELIAKYKFMENNTGERKLALEGKIPEIKKTLDMVELLIEKHVCTFGSGFIVTKLTNLGDNRTPRKRWKRTLS